MRESRNAGCNTIVSVECLHNKNELPYPTLTAHITCLIYTLSLFSDIERIDTVNYLMVRCNYNGKDLNEIIIEKQYFVREL